MFAVIMAGGGGTRLWPMSREHYPKQMHALAGDHPLVQQMVGRLHNIVGKDRVFIITNSHHAGGMAKLMPYMADHIYIDPYRRDTAPCIGLAAVYLAKYDPNAVMGVFPADHHIGLLDEFGGIVRAASKLAEEGHVVTIGIRPTGPETGYGYIEMDDVFEVVDDRKAYHVRRFVEKPDSDRAAEYVAAGNYLWNSGMFLWNIPTVMKLFEKHLPDTYERLMRISDSIGTPEESEVVDREYEQMQRISVDFGIMEKLEDTLVIPGDFDWNDIGSWATVCDISPKNEEGNSIKGLHIGFDTKNCMIRGVEKRVVATIGVEDLIVVDTEDALLICRKDRTQDVKKIVDKLKEGEMDGYL